MTRTGLIIAPMEHVFPEEELQRFKNEVLGNRTLPQAVSYVLEPPDDQALTPWTNYAMPGVIAGYAAEVWCEQHQGAFRRDALDASQINDGALLSAALLIEKLALMSKTEFMHALEPSKLENSILGIISNAQIALRTDWGMGNVGRYIKTADGVFAWVAIVKELQRLAALPQDEFAAYLKTVRTRVPGVRETLDTLRNALLGIQRIPQAPAPAFYPIRSFGLRDAGIDRNGISVSVLDMVLDDSVAPRTAELRTASGQVLATIVNIGDKEL